MSHSDRADAPTVERVRITNVSAAPETGRVEAEPSERFATFDSLGITGDFLAGKPENMSAMNPAAAGFLDRDFVVDAMDGVTDEAKIETNGTYLGIHAENVSVASPMPELFPEGFSVTVDLSYEIVANDDYFLGRPKIDRIVVQYFGDTRGLMVANMAGEVDVIPVGYLKAEEAFVLKTQWEPTGAGSLILSMVKLRNGWWQFRDPAAPWVQDARIRQAMVRFLPAISSPSPCRLRRQRSRPSISRHWMPEQPAAWSLPAAMAPTSVC
jgi:hypothetical protein